MLLILGLSDAEIALISFLLLIIAIAGPISAIISIVRSNDEPSHKIIWAIASVFIPFGWIAYFVFRRKKTI